MDLADGARMDETSFSVIKENFGLWPRVMIKSRDTDSDLERLLIELRPELVVTEMAPIRPALRRLADESYARKKAGWRYGLKWMQLMSSSPLWIYYFADMACRQANNDAEGIKSQAPTPAPFLGLPVRRKLESPDYQAQSEYFKSLLKSGGMEDTYLVLGRLASIGNLNRDSLSDTQLAELFLNESNWLNVFMFPEELDYESDLDSKLDKTRWFRVDSLIRPTSSSSKQLDRISEQLLAELASWQRVRDTDRQSKTIYVSLGTVISQSFEVMAELMQQVFTCLKTRKHWRFAVSLGKENSRICVKFNDELNYWQNDEHRLIARGWWPQPEVFKRHLADACVVHGGNNTICELFHCSPTALVVVPGMNDQLARRLEELDYGVALPIGRLLRASYQNGKETMLLDALDRAISLYEFDNRRKRSMAQQNRPRRNARYCAQVISARLNEERIGRQKAAI